MAQTTQDLQIRMDITGLTNPVSGSQINQVTATALPADDKGLNIETVDSAIDVPDVPNPDVELEGITPTYWKRYKWKRCPHADAGADAKIKIYEWNYNAAVDATLLQWELITANADAALLTAEEALAAAEAAQTTADAAQTTATGAINTANNAATHADTANTNANTALGQTALIQISLDSAVVRIAELEDNEISNPVAVEDGGTGANNVAEALINLGLGRSLYETWIGVDIKGVGVNAGGALANVWTKRDVNTTQQSAPHTVILNVDNTFTLKAGRSYSIQAIAPAVSCNSNRLLIFQIGVGGVSTGISCFAGASDNGFCLAFVEAFIPTLAVDKTYEIRHILGADNLVNGFGTAANLGGASEVYMQVKVQAYIS